MRSGNSERVRTSIRVLQVITLGLCLVVLGRVFQLQILDFDTYSPLSKKNSLRQEYVNPARGLIFDRNGTLLVDNEPIYTITITPANFDTTNIGLLANLVGVSKQEVRDRVEKARRYSWYRSSRLFTEVDFKTFSLIQENIWRLPGIGHQIESKRHYPTPVRAPHIFGYLREASEKEYNDNKKLRLGDKIGKSGLEQVYEDTLRGELGTEYVRVNALGQSLGSYNDGELDKSPVRGNDIMTTLDTDLQLTAEKLMKGKLGGLVALDPNDGSVLAMVSAPQYDVSRLAGRLDADYWQAINADSTAPLYNRAISNKQPPGSTFKPLMALIGLHLGLIKPETIIYNPGAYYRGRAYNDHAPPGKYDMVKAIAHSSNTYFFTLMDKIATSGDLNKWHDLASDFGLGHLNHIDLPSESPGILPDSSYMDRTFGKRKWGIGDVLSMGIGQGLVSASPLQMALVTSELANGGYWVQPHVVKAVRSSNGHIYRTPVNKHKIKWVKQKDLAVVQKGMRQVVTEGSGRWYANTDAVKIAGKTGTAQNPHGEDHSWFIAYAPFDKPTIAVAVLVENAGYGSLTAAPIASMLCEKYVTGEIKRKRILDMILNFKYKEGAFTEDE